jgi:hypothetical protein
VLVSLAQRRELKKSLEELDKEQKKFFKRLEDLEG